MGSFHKNIAFTLPLVGLAATAISQPARQHTAYVRLEIIPPTVRLDGREARQQLLVNGYGRDGSVVDLTRAARFASANEKVVRVDGTGMAYPAADGKTVLTARVGGRTARVTVVARNVKRPFAWDFENHVESVLSKQGCNTGPCHGAGSGKGGFRLTLRAYDPDLDYARLLYEGRGRRVVRIAPARSLLLKKPSLGVAHVGGLRLRRDTLEYRVLHEWIAAGAPGPKPNGPKIVGLEVYPADRTLQPGAEQRLLVTARFSDGHTEDVTHWAKYSSNEESIAKVDESGRVKMRGVGETAISVWYLGRVAFARLRVPYQSDGAMEWWSDGPSLHYIDRLILAKLAQLRLRPSSLCTDAEFVRRAYLDAIGTLPTPTETRAFLADRDPRKRAKLIDALLERPEYVDYWAYKWSDLLRVNRDHLGDKGMWAFYGWVRRSVAANKPWDRFVREILTARGPTTGSGPANFYRMGSKPEEFAETVSQAFLGIRVQCAHCHNHPFEKWTQADYYRMANFFARVGRKETDAGEFVFTMATGDVTHPKLGRPLPPAAFDGPALAPDAPGDRREFLADWMTAPDNPYFARAIVNRVWKHYMGRGLVEPVDDMRLTNPASNEPLLHALAKDFVAHHYDLKHLMRTIMRSRAYQRSACNLKSKIQNPKSDDRFYSHYLPRRLTAEALLDAICQVTGAPEKYPGLPDGARAISLPDTQVGSAFLDIFGRPPRQVTCECERTAEPSMAQALHLINAKTLNDKIAAKGGLIDRLLDADKTDLEILDELYLACFSRPPTRPEREIVERALASALRQAPKSDPQMVRAQVFTDLLWALLSSPEFVFNH